MAVSVHSNMYKPSPLSLQQPSLASTSMRSTRDSDPAAYQTSAVPPPAQYHSSSTSHRPIRVRIYCNGDRYFRGKQVNIFANRYSTFGDLLNDLTGRLPNGAMLAYGVRQIYSPVTGRKIRDVGQLRDGNDYVCAGFETFKPMKYGPGNSMLITQSLPSGEQSSGTASTQYGQYANKCRPLLKRPMRFTYNR